MPSQCSCQVNNCVIESHKQGQNDNSMQRQRLAVGGKDFFRYRKRAPVVKSVIILHGVKFKTVQPSTRTQ